MDILKRDDYLTTRWGESYYFKEGDIVVGEAACIESHNQIMIFSFKVLSPYREKGYGFKIIEYIKKVFKKHKKPITLCVSEDNKVAINLYRKCGFKEVFNYSKRKNKKLEQMQGIWMEFKY